ncbi:hypothetical protein JL720_15274 [Aureococcus anophagefferens]|nr:hypothetical protein JL720_15274 [Aureococcus anophagefferens]
MNAMTPALLRRLDGALRAAASRAAVGVVLRRGPHFCTGGRYGARPKRPAWWAETRRAPPRAASSTPCGPCPCAARRSAGARPSAAGHARPGGGSSLGDARDRVSVGVAARAGRRCSARRRASRSASTSTTRAWARTRRGPWASSTPSRGRGRGVAARDAARAAKVARLEADHVSKQELWLCAETSLRRETPRSAAARARRPADDDDRVEPRLEAAPAAPGAADGAPALEIEARVAAIVREFLDGDVAADAPLLDAGIDSLSASELATKLAAAFARRRRRDAPLRPPERRRRRRAPRRGRRGADRRADRRAPAEPTDRDGRPLVAAELRGSVAVLALDRPDVFNGAYGMEPALAAALDRVGERGSCSGCVVTGRGHAYHVAEHRNQIDFEPASRRFAFTRDYLVAYFAAFVAFPKPLVAALNGSAYGGAATSTSHGDAVVAVDAAELSFPFRRWRVVPGGCATAHLARLAGQGGLLREAARRGARRLARAETAPLFRYDAAAAPAYVAEARRWRLAPAAGGRDAAAAAVAAVVGGGAAAPRPAALEASPSAPAVAVDGATWVFPRRLSTAAALRSALASGFAFASEAPVSRYAAGRGAARYGAFLGGAVALEARAWAMTPVEVRAADPQQLLLLGVVAPRRGAGDGVAVFVGASGGTFFARSGADATPGGVYAATSDALAILAGRASFVFGFTGECAAVDTACSSTLAALHVARRSGGRARVCGVGLLEATTTRRTAAAGMLSPRGRCHAFDRRADGFSRAEGAACFSPRRRRASLHRAAALHDRLVRREGRCAPSSTGAVAVARADAHVVRGEVLFPGVAYVEVAATSLRDLDFVRPCVMRGDAEFRIERAEDGALEISSRAGGSFALRARARLLDFAAPGRRASRARVSRATRRSWPRASTRSEPRSSRGVWRRSAGVPSTLVFDHPSAAAIAAALAPAGVAGPAALPRAVSRERLPEASPEARVARASRLFPGGPGLRPASRWAIHATEFHAFPPPEASRYGAFAFDGEARLETSRFGASPAEARALDPQSGLVLHAAAEAAGDARDLGVFVGAGAWIRGASLPGRGDARPNSVYGATATALSLLSGRVSYALDLAGPCVSLDTACSSFLFALALAAREPGALAASVGVLATDATAFGFGGALAHGALYAATIVRRGAVGVACSEFRRRAMVGREPLFFHVGLPPARAGPGDALVVEGVFSRRAYAALGDHVVVGATIFPGVAYTAVVITGLAQARSASEALVLEAIELGRPCRVPPGGGAVFRFASSAVDASYEISSYVAADERFVAATSIPSAIGAIVPAPALVRAVALKDRATMFQTCAWATLCCPLVKSDEIQISGSLLLPGACGDVGDDDAYRLHRLKARRELGGGGARAVLRQDDAADFILSRLKARGDIVVTKDARILDAVLAKIETMYGALAFSALRATFVARIAAKLRDALEQRYEVELAPNLLELCPTPEAIGAHVAALLATSPPRNVAARRRRAVARVHRGDARPARRAAARAAAGGRRAGDDRPARTSGDAPPRRRGAEGGPRSAVATVERAVFDVVGAAVARDAPLLASGLDSLGVSELAGALSAAFGIALEPTFLFDHPTIAAAASGVVAALRAADAGADAAVDGWNVTDAAVLAL